MHVRLFSCIPMLCRAFPSLVMHSYPRAVVQCHAISFSCLTFPFLLCISLSCLAFLSFVMRAHSMTRIHIPCYEILAFVMHSSQFAMRSVLLCITFPWNTSPRHATTAFDMLVKLMPCILISCHAIVSRVMNSLMCIYMPCHTFFLSWNR